MLKIKDKAGHTIAILKDGDSEPGLTQEEKTKQARRELTISSQDIDLHELEEEILNKKENELCNNGKTTKESNKKPSETN